MRIAKFEGVIDHGANSMVSNLVSFLINDHRTNSKVSVAIVKFLTTDHGKNSRVLWSWSVQHNTYFFHKHPLNSITEGNYKHLCATDKV